MGLLMLGTIIVVMALGMGWWGKFANLIGLFSGLGGIGLALWFSWRVLVFNYDEVLVHGFLGIPYSLMIWGPLFFLGASLFLFALFGRGIKSLNRWGLIFIATGWAFYYPLLQTWQLIS